MKPVKVLISLALCCAVAVSMGAGFAVGAEPYDGGGAIATNESNLTVWIFVGVIALVAAAGIIYFIIQKRKK